MDLQIGTQPQSEVVEVLVHLVTQDDQPYGSVRRSCEECGFHVLDNTNCRDRYAESREDFENLSRFAQPGIKFIKCAERKILYPETL